jgi:TPR repeat protein
MLLVRDGVDCIISGYRLRCRGMIWLSRAADQGSADAQFNLGWMYAYGDGVAQDYAQAVIWLRKACAKAMAATIMAAMIMSPSQPIRPARSQSPSSPTAWLTSC